MPTVPDKHKVGRPVGSSVPSCQRANSGIYCGETAGESSTVQGPKNRTIIGYIWDKQLTGQTRNVLIKFEVKRREVRRVSVPCK